MNTDTRSRDEVLSGSLQGVIDHCWRLKYEDPRLDIDQLLKEWLAEYVARWLDGLPYDGGTKGCEAAEAWRKDMSA